MARLPAGSSVAVPIMLHNLRNTDDSLNIGYKVQDRIDEHAEDISLKQSMIVEKYDDQTQTERTNKDCKDCDPGMLVVHRN